MPMSRLPLATYSITSPVSRLWLETVMVSSPSPAAVMRYGVAPVVGGELSGSTIAFTSTAPAFTCELAAR